MAYTQFFMTETLFNHQHAPVGYRRHHPSSASLSHQLLDIRDLFVQSSIVGLAV